MRDQDDFGSGSEPARSGRLAGLRRWMRDARHARRTLVALALAMALVLLASYHEVLEDQMARADQAQKLAATGVVKPAVPSMNAPGARSPTEHTQAR